jgi:hypothetical protein
MLLRAKAAMAGRFGVQRLHAFCNISLRIFDTSPSNASGFACSPQSELNRFHISSPGWTPLVKKDDVE